MDDTVATLHFGSPEEPSAASWLLNCFLELGIRIDHKPVVDNVWRTTQGSPDPSLMWRTDGDAMVLNPKADMLKKWMPTLANRERFRFRSDLVVQYTQDFAGTTQRNGPAIFFVRDPRDALYSMYRRVGPDLSFGEFVDLPDRRTLLSRIDNWCYQIISWQRLSGVAFFRFEDYKSDARALLARIVDHIGVGVSDDELDRAVAASSYQKAREAEAEYRRRHPGDQEVANRAGRVGDWRERPEVADAIRHLETRSGAVIERLGYEPVAATHADLAAHPPATSPYLAFFQQVLIPAGVPAAADNDGLDRLRRFAATVDEDLLSRSRLSPAQIRQLLDSLNELLRKSAGHTEPRLATLKTAFEDGSDRHFDRIRQLLAQRRSRQ